ncbi:hypothetical protein P43SY_009804 [Pythium insidiosum]|uniref:SGNH domain-containing protein n=1 Tax=Pythium insidiosum TaxID=114742 RepID=A0AAD5Q4X6_PYTIN|nr:hypothetical protein P43SY_009804 [Pythium insidiosum]
MLRADRYNLHRSGDMSLWLLVFFSLLGLLVFGHFLIDVTFDSFMQYMDNILSSKATRDAEIVIVILGSHEYRVQPSCQVGVMQKNLVAVCDTLRKKGKHVCLATIASPSPLGQEEKIPLNAMLEEFCASTKGDDTPVVLGPRLDTYAFRRESSLAFDSYHFSSNGFKLLARNTADFLVPIMTGVEWKTWKKQLEKVTYDKTLYE